MQNFPSKYIDIPICNGTSYKDISDSGSHAYAAFDLTIITQQLTYKSRCNMSTNNPSILSFTVQ